MSCMEQANPVKWHLAAAGAAVLVSLGLAAYFYAQTVQLKNSSAKQGEERANQVLEELSQIIVLPTDEQPTVAEVTDPELLKDHPFLAKAKKGDFIIVFTKSQKAYLYDPVAHKIIDVGSVSSSNEAEAENSPAPTTPNK